MTKMKGTSIGLIGLGTMGSALARNMASKGFSVTVYNRTYEKTKEFLEKYATESEGKARDLEMNLFGFEHLDDFVNNLQKPRRIVLMVPAGKPIDEMIDHITPLLEEGDILIDGGNSWYKDTQTRQEKLKHQGIHFIGMGISGGEKGALIGPSMMPGGSPEAWEKCREIFEACAARDFSGKPCVAYMGEGGSGHYVKMVHNGIEYAVMQLISEAYDLMKNVAGYENDEIAEVFEQWNKGPLQSFLIEIAGAVMRKKEGNVYMIDMILDIAGQKGTGIWTTLEALEQGIPVNTIAEAVFARAISAQKKLRTRLALEKKTNDKKTSATEFRESLEKALLQATSIAYAQGFALLRSAPFAESLNLAEIARIWQGGCIIRARMLEKIEKSFASRKEYLLEDFKGEETEKGTLESLKSVVTRAIEHDRPVPAFSSGLQYYQSMTTNPLNTNMIQALRDYFGAHGFQRKDKEGNFHGNWDEGIV
jgi:6-phosphogluconate dehydrogenase